MLSALGPNNAFSYYNGWIHYYTVISGTLRQPPFKLQSKDGHYSNTQRQLYSLKSLFLCIVWIRSKSWLQNSEQTAVCSTVRLNSVWETTCKQIYRPRMTQIRLTESTANRRANRLGAASHLSSCRVKRWSGLHVNSPLFGNRSDAKLSAAAT